MKLNCILSYLLLWSVVACDVGVLNSSKGDGSFNDSSGSTENTTSTTTTNTTQTFSADVSPSGNPFCTSTMGVDGENGFLWRPVSEKDGLLVLLFPAAFTEVFLSVCVFNSIDDSKECGIFEAFSNGERQTWRFSQPGSAYTGQVEVDDMGQSCVWEVSNPDTEQD